jgi:hypothetical protein
MSALPRSAPTPFERIEYGRRIGAVRDRIETSTELNARERVVMLRIAKRCNYGFSPVGCYEKAANLAPQCGITDRHLRSIVSKLATEEWLEVEHHVQRKGRRGYRTIRLGWKALLFNIHAPTGAVGAGGNSPVGAGGSPLPSDGPPPPEGGVKTEETTTKRSEPETETSSSFDCMEGELSETKVVVTPATIAMAPPAAIAPAEAPGLPQDGAELDQAPLSLAALMAALVAWVVGLGLRRSKSDQTPIDGTNAQSLIARAAKFYPGGLRWVAWAIHEAAHRKGPDRGPVKFWVYLVRTLENWKAGNGAPPEGWPELPGAHGARVAPPKPPPPKPLDPEEQAILLEATRKELAAGIARTEQDIAEAEREAAAHPRQPWRVSNVNLAREELDRLRCELAAHEAGGMS